MWLLFKNPLAASGGASMHAPSVAGRILDAVDQYSIIIILSNFNAIALPPNHPGGEASGSRDRADEPARRNRRRFPISGVRP